MNLFFLLLITGIICMLIVYFTKKKVIKEINDEMEKGQTEANNQKSDGEGPDYYGEIYSRYWDETRNEKLLKKTKKMKWLRLFIDNSDFHKY